MVFREKFHYDQITVLLRYWVVCVLQLYVSELTTQQILKLILAFQLKLFFYMAKKSGQKFKYLKNEKNF